MFLRSELTNTDCLRFQSCFSCRYTRGWSILWCRLIRGRSV